jgi:mevalonate kinase
MTTAATAPGKIILFGEHAVVYGRPALAVPVTQVQARASIQKTGGFSGEKWADSVLIQAPDIGLFSSLSRIQAEHATHPLDAVIQETFQRLGITRPPAFTLTIKSSIPVASGLGSGAAVSVAVIRALAALCNQTISDEQVSQIAYEIEKLHHGTPSGIDNTVIAYAKPVYFVRNPPSPIGRGVGGEGDNGAKIQPFKPRPPLHPPHRRHRPGRPQRKESVGDVRKLWEADKSRWETVFDKVGEIVREAKNAIESGDISRLGPLMDTNHALLQEMTVSSPELDRLVLTAKSAGAGGAKLSGGGRGGNMIALVQPKEKAPAIAQSLRKAGAKNVIITQVG